MNESYQVLCNTCKTTPAIIPRGRFNKQPTYCSDYCKSKQDLKGDILWFFLLIIPFFIFDLIIDQSIDLSLSIFNVISYGILLVILYSIIKNYVFIRNHEPSQVTE